MEERVLTACRRTDFGKAATAKCRRADRLPAVIYDNAGHSTAIDVPYRDFEKLFKTVTESTLITVKVDDTDEFEVFIKFITQISMLLNAVSCCGLKFRFGFPALLKHVAKARFWKPVLQNLKLNVCHAICLSGL